MIEHDGCVGCSYESYDEDSDECRGCTQNAVDKYRPTQNRDIIRNMSDSDLAQFLCDISSGCCRECIAYKYCEVGRLGCNGFKEWLKMKTDCLL